MNEQMTTKHYAATTASKPRVSPPHLPFSAKPLLVRQELQSHFLFVADAVKR